MNKTVQYSSDHPWSRRCSTETVFSCQGFETDTVRDTSDTDEISNDQNDVEYEPVTESESDAPADDDTSTQSDDIISTKVIQVSVGDDGDLQFADSEEERYESDSEIDFHDYWQCARCGTENTNSLYRYCQKCYKVRKSLFPPPPKRKCKRQTSVSTVMRTISEDSGVDTARSQEILSQESPSNAGEGTSKLEENKCDLSNIGRSIKRRSSSADRLDVKRQKIAHNSDSEASDWSRKSVKSITNMVSDPCIDASVKVTKKVIANTLKEKLETSDMCVVCVSEPKTGVFVHGRIAHICCCYKCAVKVWRTSKRCPVCNCKVSNVLKAVVM